MKIPKTLGRYEIVDVIGHGGMGSLFRARDPRIGRFVAIKMLRPEFDTPEVRDRFSREARAAGSLSHPNIVTIYDVGEDDGHPFIAMEFVRGETFEDLAGLRPPLPVTRKIQLIEEVCHGLAHAHEQGIVHRDIKPANLILGSEGVVKILDFGIAKLTASGMTVTGTIMGTLNYMSPEQITGASVDARADIFAVGAVFYELLSHQQAFPGNKPAELLHRIVSGSPKPVTDFCPDLDPRLVHVIDRALEKDPEDRFQNIASMQSELASIRLNAPPSQRSPEGKRMTRAGSEIPPNAGSSSAPPRKTPRPIQDELTKLRARQIETHMAAAERAFSAGQYDAASESCRQVLLLDGSDERALSLLDRIHAEIEDQRPAATSKPEIDDGDIAPTIRGPNPILRDLEERRLAAERAERLDRTLRDLDERLTQNDLAAAGGLLEAAVSIAPGDSRVQAARARLEQARAAAAAAEARERNTREKLAEAQAHLEKGNLADAAAVLKGVADVAPEHPAVLEFSERLRVATEQRAAAEAAERRQKQVRDLLQSASQKLASSSDQASELTIALQEVTEALTLDSENAEAGTLKTSIEAAIAARREEARVKTAIGNARSRFAIGKHQAALHLLEEFEPAGKPEIASVLDELRKALHEIEEQRRLERERIERQERVTALAAAARTALRKQQFDTALEHLAKAAEADPASPEVKTLTEEANAQRAAALRERKTEELLDDVEQRITTGDLVGAGDVLRMAAHLSPSNARVSTLKQRNEAAIAAKREAEAQAREAEARAREAEARAREEEARRKEEEARAREAEARAREAQETISSAEEKLQAGDLEGARALAKHAATLDPQPQGLESLAARIEDAVKTKEAAEAAERLKQTVTELTAAASGMLDAVQQRPNDIIPAMQKIARALELSPKDSEAQSLKLRAEQIYNAQRQEAFVRAALGNARTRFAMGKHQAAFQLLESLDPGANPLVASTLAELREALRQLEAQKAAQAASPSPPQATPPQTNIDSSEIDIAAAATARDSSSTTIRGSMPPLHPEPEEPRGRWDLVALAIVVLIAVIAVLMLLGMYGV